MHAAPQRLRHWLTEACLFARRQAKGHLMPTGRLRILFSRKDDWEADIRRGFRYSRHQLAFESMLTARIEDYDLVVPLTIWDLRELDRLRHRLSDNPLSIPSWQSVSLCNDKYLLNLRLIQEGFGMLVPVMGEAMPYPHVFKKRIDAWGMHSHVVWDRSQELQLLRGLDGKDYFRQDPVPGRLEYATHVLFRDGAIIHSLSIEYRFASDLFIRGKGCEALDRKALPCMHSPTFASILRAIGFEGLCCFNYKLVDGQPRIFEINPRFGASLSEHFMTFLPYIVSTTRRGRAVTPAQQRPAA